ncbi:3-ketodihydrosphingosine reductase [Prorops nasuta]|uniref:3-ketodihydrosphingosine reductase n=1 Tax=Prorops nasuta TaxID=863751 RepID=UPI0034CEAC37
MVALVGLVIVGLVLFIVALLAKEFFYYGKLQNIENKHVVITGGSSGIGKSAAIIAARLGAHVTIIARDIEKLEAAKNEIIHNCKNKDSQKIEYLSVDITQSYADVEKALKDCEKSTGPIYMLINCAGTAICGRIEDISPESLHKLININFVGTFYCIKAVVPRMKANREGIIVLTSSQAGLFGLYGYSAYCGTKFAVRGLAESTAMELSPYGISVTLSLPPDTDTPGYSIEEQTKPLETKLITQSDILVSADSVAEKLMKDALAKKFFSTLGMDGFVLTILCSGAAPFASICELILQSFLMGFMRLILAGYLVSFQRIIKGCMKTRDKNKKFE